MPPGPHLIWAPRLGSGVLALVWEDVNNRDLVPGPSRGRGAGGKGRVARRPRLAPGGLRTWPVAAPPPPRAVLTRCTTVRPRGRRRNCTRPAPAPRRGALRPLLPAVTGAEQLVGDPSPLTHGTAMGPLLDVPAPFLLGDAQSQDCNGVASRSFHQSFLLGVQEALSWNPRKRGLSNLSPMFGFRVLLFLRPHPPPAS